LNNHSIIVRLALPADKIYSITITQEMEESAKARGTGIAKRSSEYIERKIDEGKAVIAVTEDGTWVGFCYIEAWEHEKYVANSGLIVSPAFRKSGVAKSIKHKIFMLSREKYPDAKIFGLTTGLAVMKINSDLGYEPVTYSELTNDEEFWKGCKSCINYEILMSKNRMNCLCTGMLFDPAEVKQKQELVPVEVLVNQPAQEERRHFKGNFKLFERWIRFKQFVLLGSFRKNENGTGNPVEKKNSILGIFFW
jgi:hypothetical protein